MKIVFKYIMSSPYNSSAVACEQLSAVLYYSYPYDISSYSNVLRATQKISVT